MCNLFVMSFSFHSSIARVEQRLSRGRTVLSLCRASALTSDQWKVGQFENFSLPLSLSLDTDASILSYSRVSQAQFKSDDPLRSKLVLLLFGSTSLAFSPS